jgi:hypothetical protein
LDAVNLPGVPELVGGLLRRRDALRRPAQLRHPKVVSLKVEG